MELLSKNLSVYEKGLRISEKKTDGVLLTWTFYVNELTKKPKRTVSWIFS